MTGIIHWKKRVLLKEVQDYPTAQYGVAHFVVPVIVKKDVSPQTLKNELDIFFINGRGRKMVDKMYGVGERNPNNNRVGLYTTVTVVDLDKENGCKSGLSCGMVVDVTLKIQYGWV
jgi:hypothetical protein